MSTGARLAVAAAVVLVDVVLFALPLTGMLAAYVIIARPPWFRAFVERLYHDVAASGTPGGGPATDG
jgi:hypothetical protein